MKILGLDYGDKRIGVAASDALGWTAQGKKVIQNTSLNEVINELEDLIDEYEIGKVVVGLPKNMNGTLGPRAEKTLEFVEALKEEFTIPIITWDERLSTAAAERTLLAADVSRRKRKDVIDKMAAVVILQNYLDSQ
ncbi:MULTISPECIES: Holliday junction resolvase RuvX [unclassified Candidatus Frackibacter]|uniref:Holliday junction resolvase RuvX n=1 Tax=unclassified Candidatus Frackibacter TaxID=2648818 RepID=UPI0007936F0C|nr:MULTISPECIES: Holliday junction resolvase RuvX [unclassified Candidatus Frackibacter]KXS42498.1 MAG: putative holliday junction resolvase [Candidatus Frackibacter sp. T328-2]SDC86682.1 putative holliday junction resolvase [Candidatus Frackibacter sp. WG11]SEN00929.1 putative holliday junction resolvase [Candidatus Frackibacter sp. WG12]SFM08531.1 putative holliday junction resolvase [Candidatus Frackibacter sp. WG13]